MDSRNLFRRFEQTAFSVLFLRDVSDRAVWWGPTAAGENGMKGKRMLHKFVDWIGMGGSTGGLACGGAEGIGQRNPTPGEGFSEGAEHHVSCVGSQRFFFSGCWGLGTVWNRWTWVFEKPVG